MKGSGRSVGRGKSTDFRSVWVAGGWRARWRPHQEVKAYGGHQEVSEEREVITLWG